MAGALEGIKVLDLSRLGPGVFCTMLLGDLGADVIRVEEQGPPEGRRAEQSRGAVITPAIEGLVEPHSPFNVLGRNKKSIGLNLKSEGARNVFYKLAEKGDVVVEEFRPGVSKRLRIDYESLKEINPGIIYCAITNYGQDGPYRNLVAHDPNCIAMAGALGIIGERGSRPVMPWNFLGDFAAGGIQAAVGILAALIARERTGKGQFVDISMTDGVISLLSQLLSGYFSAGKIPERGDYGGIGAAPYLNLYETKDGKYLTVSAVEPWFWANLCRALGREDFIPYQYNIGQKQDEIESYFRQVFRTKTRDEWFDLLTQTDICVGKVYTFDELESDPQIHHRKMIVEIDHPKLGKIKQVGISIKLSETPGEIRSLTPALGEHTEEVLLSLGYTQNDIYRLRSVGAIP
jgi:crotonobetainyl-CoA:carnitine CoA-transferase CaiB-like acyl-CoA transferase